MGNGTSGTTSKVPVEVEGSGGTGYLTGVVMADGGHNHSAAVLGDGSVWTWGDNGDGQLGNGGVGSHTTPIQARTQAGMTSLAAGDWHTLAISTTQALTTTYTYDALYRLLSGGTPGNPTSYTYDPVGNRLSKTVGPASNSTSSTYDKADELLTVGGASYTVNADGNLTAAGSSSFSYDGDGKRASRAVRGTTTNYTWDVVGSLPNVLGDGTLKYVYGLGLAYTMDSSNNIQVLHTDGLGSVRAITNSGGSVIQTFQTDEFGVPALTQGTNTEPFRYTGQQLDPETGFDDLRARYFSPSLGRFETIDMSVRLTLYPQSLNRFSYALGNPATLVDASGYGAGRINGKGDTDNPRFSTGGGAFDGFLFTAACFNTPYGTLIVGVVSTPTGPTEIPFVAFASSPGQGGSGSSDDESAAEQGLIKGRATRQTKNWSCWFNSERDARAIAREVVGYDLVDVGSNEIRSADGK